MMEVEKEQTPTTPEVMPAEQAEPIAPSEPEEQQAAEVPEAAPAQSVEEQISLFDDDEVPKQQVAEAASAKKKTPAKKADANQKVNPDFMVYYAGKRIAVPESDMSLEQLRVYLEGDFPELSKERTEMTVDMTKKEVVPVVKGAKKG